MKTFAGLTDEAAGKLIEDVGAREERRAIVAFLRKIGFPDIAQDIEALRHLGA